MTPATDPVSSASRDPRLAMVGAGGTDLDVAARFYESLGFDIGPVFDLGTAIADQSRTPGVPLRIRMARRDGMTIELLQHGAARPAGPPVRRAMNQPGLTHLALVTDDIDRTARLIGERGGSVFPLTRAGTGPADGMLFCADPSGVRLLLLAPAADALGGPAPGDDGLALHHIGLTVTDLDRTVAFWTGIGFASSPVGRAAGRLPEAAELPGAEVTRCALTQDGFRFEATQWGPARTPAPVMLPLNRSGDLVHLGTHVDDFGAALRRIRDLGGTVVEATRGVFPPPGLGEPDGEPPHGWIFVLDPDGVSIEVVGPEAAR